ncbi:sugar ABC transporter permease [Eubacterium sp. am_0171]|nr:MULTISPECIES: sugar ABC transporter permease [unclassified Eubacterium (in: firmicutes)]MCI6432823.1 sugar ABC transporter permease [Lachnospiraceae bacterium]MSC84475.1 ABC transporter permease subunit [Eubacterium sp. BIOML-A1]MSD08347.1 ABC transporter permease subunit [Eubacterium sp. BIOML-A2]RYT12536.1 sugar ABC transporter permease [Eubacterium sp. am_0171]
MKKRNKNMINLFYLPALILFAVFVIYPFMEGIRISFTNWNGYSQNYTYVGAKNYIQLFQDKNVRTALINTLIYGIGSTFLQNVIGLLYAVFLDSKFRGRMLVRTIIYLPVMIAPLVMGYMMYFLVQYDNGAINDILAAFGRQPVDWMNNGFRAVILMTLINSLQFVGISMVIYMAGLQGIPGVYYEAAAIDGVSGFQAFRSITLPLLTPAITSAVVINLIGGLKLFDIIMALTMGGPGYSSHSLSTLITNQYFRAQNAGYSAAIGVGTFLLIMFISNVTMRYFDKKEVYS